MLENEGATPDGIEVEELEAASMDDTIRAELQRLTNGEGLADEAETSAVSRDESGRFAPKPAEPEAKAEATLETPVDAAPEIAPPNSWKKEAKAEWLRVPPAVQQEISRREADFHKGIEQYRDTANFGHSIRQVLDPYMPVMQRLGVQPDQAIAGLLAADAKLRFGSPEEKVQYFAHLANEYGIDLGKAQEFKPAPMDPTIAALKNELWELKSHIQSQQNLGQQQEEASLYSEIDRFAADPAHPHFEAVRGHMAALLQAQLATSLEDAYAQAVYANPETRAQLTQQQMQAQREEAAKRASEARKMASVNVRSRPTLPADIAAGQTMDDTLRETYRRITAS